MSLEVLQTFAMSRWTAPFEGIPQGGLEGQVESGRVLYFPSLSFALENGEQRFLAEHWADIKAKNISYRGTDQPLRGALGNAKDLAELRAMLARFAEQSESLVHGLFPRYRPHLRRGFTSYRTAQVEARVTSWRKDDTRLHVDAFPSNPTGGLRLLRVFTNLNPFGRPRVWRVGEPFAAHAARFLAQARKPCPLCAWGLEKLGLTKSRRTAYDHYMGQLHDLGKADLDYQRNSPQTTVELAAGSTWVVFSDQVLHAVMAGQYLLEQTFYLDPLNLVEPASGPLAILEGLTGRPLRT